MYSNKLYSNKLYSNRLYSDKLYSNKLVGIGALALALLMGAGTVVSHAHDDDTAKSPPCDIGMVDMERIYNASEAPAEFLKEADQIEGEAQKRIDGMMLVPALTPNELKEYGELIGKNAPDAAQQKRIDDLKKLSDNRVDELSKLQTSNNLGAQEKARMQELIKDRRVAEQFIQVIQEGFRRQALEREDGVKRTQLAQLRAEVAKVAKEKKISHVFDINALVYSTNDLTQPVIQKLDKHTK